MNKHNNITIQDILFIYKTQFLNKFSKVLSKVQLQSYYQLLNCRTERMGSRIMKCNCCNEKFELFNSCKNRHCPTCGNMEREIWLLERKKNVLPVPYYHLVFTVPKELKNLIYSNQKLLLNLLFKVVGETIKELSLDKKFLNGKTGIISILHTWGQNLIYHPHIHCLIPFGSIAKDNKTWQFPKNKNFLFPYNVIKKLFRDKFLFNLNKLYEKQPETFSFKFDPNLTKICNWKSFKNILYLKKWVVHQSKPIKNPENVIDYFGRYAYKTAITDFRIIKLENDEVFFKIKDYKNKTNEVIKLKAIEFIRRFLLHILPKRFCKIRYYGIFSNSNMKKYIKLIFEQLPKNKDSIWEFYELVKNDKSFVIQYFLKWKINVCPKCKKGKLISIENFIGNNRSP